MPCHIQLRLRGHTFRLQFDGPQAADVSTRFNSSGRLWMLRAMLIGLLGEIGLHDPDTDPSIKLVAGSDALASPPPPPPPVQGQPKETHPPSSAAQQGGRLQAPEGVSPW